MGTNLDQGLKIDEIDLSQSHLNEIGKEKSVELERPGFERGEFDCVDEFRPGQHQSFNENKGNSKAVFKSKGRKRKTLDDSDEEDENQMADNDFLDEERTVLKKMKEAIGHCRDEDLMELGGNLGLDQA